MRKHIVVLLSAVLMLALVLGGCGGNKAAESNNETTSNEELTIRVGHVLPETHATHISLAEVFKKEVEKNSKGKIKVELYPNAQLGGDRQEIEAVGLGTLEMCIPAGSVLAGFDENFMVFDLPFLFKSREAAFKALDSDFGKKIGEGLKSQNIVNLGFGENGFRNITNNVRPIHTPEDLKGIKIRTMENPIHMTTFRAFGANPTPMAFGELFTALQQKTVDAQENPVAIIYTSKFYEVQKYLTLSGHVYANCPYLINKDFYEGLSDDLRKVVDEAIKNTINRQRELTAKQEKEFITELKENGMEINELTSEEKDAFIKAAQPAYDEFVEKYGSELVDMAKSYNE
ncbi:TRAP transporter substrate-binding protein [Paramaledivibacter caminithermalis]|uniref:Tripartite ATP-independent transporter solute receptor, DctP family n=1 Tax=Paramaledivibacter caminithermalis (strain DSM 15212 / CIP 107654 / DViRD3) TaxID=1121301 RepID=A0A1M6QE65_PARC5|nr:DctP family TRAP transporter solute-binding subunit [Paramaledivibacter caminithermalis]SHK18468.1 tripartite ATP-independent transporter solute receptor, DctP family [Paramaledivibacter caminithermalis DSM 15212]